MIAYLNQAMQNNQRPAVSKQLREAQQDRSPPSQIVPALNFNELSDDPDPACDQAVDYGHESEQSAKITKVPQKNTGLNLAGLVGKKADY